MTANSHHQTSISPRPSAILWWLGAIGLAYLLLGAVGAISLGFQAAAGNRARDLFAFATNPLAGLLVGTLTTALLQSSSAVTAIIVGLVAGGLPVALAVPMVMGANIGTTITNTLVSLGHIRQPQEFRRAFAAATVHDFFNLLCAAIFLPLEVSTHFLARWASSLGQWLAGISLQAGDFNLTQAVTAPFLNLLQALTGQLPPPLAGIALICLGIALTFTAILYLGKLLKLLLVGQAQQLLRGAIGRGALAGIVSGAFVTALVQSSSTTTSLMVPLAGMGLLSLSEIYPFTLGANIGTCVTALLAATAVGENAAAALEIALVHLLYNFLGVLLIYGLPWLRNLPLLGAETLAAVASQRRVLALFYILGVFFLLPGFLLFIN
jgi:sodium-dependent phosphate cotransporter